MFVPCSGTLDLATLSGLKQPHTPLILVTLFLHVVIQVRFPLKLLLRNGRISRTFVSLEPDAGQRFPLDSEDLSSIHGVLNVVSLDMLLGEKTTKSKTLPLIESLCHGMLSLKKVSLIGRQQVQGRTYQYSKQTQKRIHPLIKELTHQSLTLTPPITKLSIMPLIHQSLTLTPPMIHQEAVDPDHAHQAPHHNTVNPNIAVIPVGQRRSTRLTKPSQTGLQSTEYREREVVGRNEGQDWANVTISGLMDNHDDVIACLNETKASHNIPRSYRHAMATDPDRWMIPMKIEMETLKLKHTWDLVKPPPGADIMDSMWVYDIKWDGEGNRIKDKA